MSELIYASSLPELKPTQILLLYRGGTLAQIVAKTNQKGVACGCCGSEIEIGEGQEFDAYQIVDLAQTKYYTPKQHPGTVRPSSAPKVPLNTTQLLDQLGSEEPELINFLAEIPDNKKFTVVNVEGCALTFNMDHHQKSDRVFKASSKLTANIKFEVCKTALGIWVLEISPNN